MVPKWELTQVADTSGVSIPGHGTPTVLLFARCTPPSGKLVRAVLGKRGEPTTPDIAADGKVWRAIRSLPATDAANDDSPYVSLAMVPQETFAQHPWSLSGGHAPALQERLEGAAEEVLSERLGKGGSVGNLTKMIQDDVYFGFDDGLGCDDRHLRD